MAVKILLGALLVLLHVSVLAPYLETASIACRVWRGWPRRDPELLRIEAAERYLKRGKAREALDILAPVKVLDSNRGFNVTLIRAAACCMLEGNCRRVLDATEPGRFTCLMHSCKELEENLLRYCAHTAKHGSPQAAAELVRAAMSLDRWMSPRCDLMMLEAEYRFQGGDRKGAASLCQSIWDDGTANNWKWINVADNNALRRRLTSLREKVGPGEERWLTGREVRPFPPGCRIYLQPLGESDAKLMADVCERVEAFFGAKAGVLPALPLSKRDPSYLPATDAFNADRLRPEALKRLRVPEDALAVVMVTRERIGTPHIPWIISQSDGNGHLISTCKWREWSHYWQLMALGKCVISLVSRQLGLRGYYPCVTSGMGHADVMRRVKFAYAPDIQEAYRALDLEAAQRRSVEAYREGGAEIVAAGPE